MKPVLDVAYVHNLKDMGDFLQYLVSVYGVEIYGDKQRLCSLIADLFNGEERVKRLYKRLIISDGLALKVYALLSKSLSERMILYNRIVDNLLDKKSISVDIVRLCINNFVRGLFSDRYPF